MSATDSRGRRRRDPVWPIFALTFAFFFALKIHQRLSFRTPFEIADYELLLWNTLHGRLLRMPCSDLSFFAEHFSPILLLVAPIYALVQSPITLLALHSLAAASAVVPLAYLVRTFTESRWPPVAFALAYAVSRIVSYGLMYDVHPESLYPLLFFGIFLAARRRRWIPFYLLLALAFMVKEDAFVAAFGLGLFLVASRERTHGLVTAGVSAVGLIAVVLFVIPHFQGESAGTDYRFASYWAGYGTTQREVLVNFLNPARHAEVIFTPPKLRRMFNLFSVVAFLPFFSWRALAFLVLPCWFMLYSSDNRLMNRPLLYYGMLITPFLFYASLHGIATIQRIRPASRDRAIVILASVVFLIHLGNSRVFKQIFQDSWEVPARYRVTAKEILAMIPPDAGVSAQVHLVPHVPLHPCRSCFPKNLDRCDYILLDSQGNWWPLAEETYRETVDSIMGSPEWEVLADWDGFQLLGRAER